MMQLPIPVERFMMKLFRGFIKAKLRWEFNQFSEQSVLR